MRLIKTSLFSAIFIYFTITLGHSFQKERKEDISPARTTAFMPPPPSVLESSFNSTKKNQAIHPNTGYLQEKEDTQRACAESKKIGIEESLSKCDPFNDDDLSSSDSDNDTNNDNKNIVNHKSAPACKIEKKNTLVSKKFASLDLDTQQHIKDLYMEYLEDLQKEYPFLKSEFDNNSLWKMLQNFREEKARLKKAEKELENEYVSIVSMQFSDLAQIASAPDAPKDPIIELIYHEYCNNEVTLKQNKANLETKKLHIKKLLDKFFNEPQIQLNLQKQTADNLKLFDVIDLSEVNQFLKNMEISIIKTLFPNQ